MCQLTFINTSNKDFNKIFLVNQYLVNTINTHQDGWGVFTEDSGVFKTEVEPWLTSNLGVLIKNKITSSKSIIAHVRLASYTNAKKEVSMRNSHPFETKDFILAHNGMFEGEIIKEERFKDKIDSEIFAIVLQETYDKFPKMKLPNLLKEAYTEFTGKFALLIYFKPKNRYFIARGKSAKLFKIDIFEGESKKKSKKIGFVINTDKVDLLRSFNFSTKQSQLDKSAAFFFKGEIEELKENKVYIVNATYLRAVGKIEEKDKVIVSKEWESSRYDNHEHLRNRRGGVIPQRAGTINNNKYVEFLLRLYDFYGLTATEIDTLFLQVTGFATITADKEQFDLFEELLTPLLEEFSTHKKNVWKKLCTHVSSPIEAYNGYEVQFPYFLNDIRILDSKWKVVKNANKGGTK